MHPLSAVLAKAQFKVQWSTSDFRQQDAAAPEEIREGNWNIPLYKTCVHWKMEVLAHAADEECCLFTLDPSVTAGLQVWFSLFPFTKKDAIKLYSKGSTRTKGIILDSFNALDIFLFLLTSRTYF